MLSPLPLSLLANNPFKFTSCIPDKPNCSGLLGLSLASVEVAELLVARTGGEGDLDTAGSDIGNVDGRDRGLENGLLFCNLDDPLVGDRLEGGRETLRAAGEVELRFNEGRIGDAFVLVDDADIVAMGLSGGGGDGPCIVTSGTSSGVGIALEDAGTGKGEAIFEVEVDPLDMTAGESNIAFRAGDGAEKRSADAEPNVEDSGNPEGLYMGE